jgi:uncharacterized protein (DUF433 family)
MARRATKSKPFSIRLSLQTNRFVEAEARRTKRSKGAIVEALTEEAARMRRFPGIGFRDEDANRRAWVVGTGLDVWELIQMVQDCDGAIERLLEEHENVTRRAVELAQAYYASYPEEIDEKIADNRRPFSELRELYPFAEFIAADGNS